MASGGLCADSVRRLNTVHVDDVAAAMWHLANQSLPNGSVFNLADKSNLSEEPRHLFLLSRCVTVSSCLAAPGLRKLPRGMLLVRCVTFTRQWHLLVSSVVPSDLGLLRLPRLFDNQPIGPMIPALRLAI